MAVAPNQPGFIENSNLNSDQKSLEAVQDSPGSSSTLSQPAVWLSRYLFFMAIATMFVMALGSATRVMNAGLSCPDWPLCYGELVPIKEMNLLVFLEWFHRVVASSMGLFSLILVGSAWRFRDRLPRWLPGAAILALAIVICQGMLGGLTVTQLLRFDIVTAHLGTGLLFFSTLLSMAIALTLDTFPNLTKVSVSRQLIKWVGFAAVLSVYCQSILGALVASQWAVHQCLSSPEPVALCGVLGNHFLGVAPASVSSLAVVYFAWRDRNSNSLAKWAGLAVAIALIAQIILGITTYKLQLQVPTLTILHQFFGAALLGALIIFTVVISYSDKTNDQYGKSNQQILEIF
jgi:heme a synthase